MRQAHPEAQLQQAVFRTWVLLGTPGSFIFHPTNEGKRSVWAGIYLKKMGMVPGIADLICVGAGLQNSALELKAKGKKASIEQAEFAVAWSNAGGRYDIADNLDDAVRILRDWGFIRRVAAYG